MTDTQQQTAATVEEAIAQAGTTQLSHLGGRTPHTMTIEEIDQYNEDNRLTGPPLEGEVKRYTGPYTDPDDERNVWTYVQDLGLTTRVSEQVPQAEEAQEKQRREGEAQRSRDEDARREEEAHEDASKKKNRNR